MVDKAGRRVVTIPHLGRVEGHGGIVVEVAGGEVVDVNMEIHEGSRFYEALLIGKHFLEVQGIITRVCAICSAGHSVAALTALENALGIEVSDRVAKLRKLLLFGGMIESHALHVFALALPDFLGYDSVLSMAGAHRKVVAFSLELKQLGNSIQTLIGGRAVHPVNPVVGGFGKLPAPDDLLSIQADLRRVADHLMKSVEFASSIEIPQMSIRPAVYLAVRPATAHYGFMGQELASTSGLEWAVEDFRDAVREIAVERCNALHARLGSGEPYIVGSLARLRLWGDRLTGRATEAVSMLFPDGLENNILTNNWAQLVELVHCVEAAADLCGELVGSCGPDRDMCRYEKKAGRGVAAIEVPRGTLIHEYTIDGDGCVTSAEVVTPTSQNLASIEADLRQTAQNTLAADPNTADAVLRSRLSMVARAYDPCISCSVHVVRSC